MLWLCLVSFMLITTTHQELACWNLNERDPETFMQCSQMSRHFGHDSLCATRSFSCRYHECEILFALPLATHLTTFDLGLTLFPGILTSRSEPGDHSHRGKKTVALSDFNNRVAERQPQRLCPCSKGDPNFCIESGWGRCDLL
jgi:hypothetical protein